MTIEQVGEFHAAFGTAESLVPTVPSREISRLRVSLITEEAREVDEAVMGLYSADRDDWTDLADVLKELCDLQYVLDGAVRVFGFTDVWREAQRRVHASNMSKLDPETGRPIQREDGKVLKGPMYEHPDLRDLIGDAR